MKKLLLTLAMVFAAHAAEATPIQAVGPVIIIDGDTIQIDGVRIRILEIDTPETYRPRCEAELVKGLEAKARLRQLIDSGQVSYEPTDLDRYHRTLAYVYVNGSSVGQVLLQENYALPYRPGPVAKAQRLSRWCP
jgi:endonuclease YncB( thermonuclease family)